MNRTLWIFLLSIALLAAFTGCEVVTYQADGHKFMRGSLGVNSQIADLIVVVKKDTRVIVLRGLNQNQSDSASSIASAITTALAKSIIP